MTEKEIEATKWAREFKRVDPNNYLLALRYAMSMPLRVDVYKTYELDELAENVWVISIDNFWMDAKKTKKEAVALCKEMGWKIND